MAVRSRARVPAARVPAPAPAPAPVPFPDAEAVVKAFNKLGYTETFAAVAASLNIEPEALYVRYSSRESLGEAWLGSIVPKAAPPGQLGEAFSHLVLMLLRTLEHRRDFGRPWVAALLGTAPLQSERLKNLHEYVFGYFISWLDTNQSSLGLPPDVLYVDVRIDLGDILSMLSASFLVSWEADRSLGYVHTRRRVEAMRYLLDALLIKRDDFGKASLLTHLYTLLQSIHAQHLRPLLDIALSPGRMARFGDLTKLAEAVRRFVPPAA